MKVVFGIGLFLVSFFVYANETVDRATVEELLEIANSKAMVEQMYAETEKMVEGISEQMGIKEKERPVFEKFMSTIMSEMQDKLSWEKMKGPLIDVYMKHYTQKEIEEILAFYKTETGQSLIKKMPQVMADSMQVSQSMFKEFLPRIMELAKQMDEDVKASRSAGE